MAYDWLLIKSEYVQGYPAQDGQIVCPTLEQLCERHGCSLSTILKKSAKEKWQQERNIYGIKRNNKIQEKKLNILVEESANIDNKALTIANKGLEFVNKRLDEEDLSNHDVMKLSNTASTFHKMGRLALGEPTEHTYKEATADVKFNNNIQKRILSQEGYSD